MTDKLEIIDKNEVAIFEQIDREKVKSQIYEVRGLRVMLDRDIAAYFGVETGALNRAMKRNIKRFPPEFCFQLTTEECSRCQIGILNISRGSNIKYLPYAYSEHGITMLTSVLHSERAINASVLIVRVFVEVAHYILQNTQLLPYEELKLLQNKQEKLSDKIHDIEEKMVSKDELSDFMKLFDTGISNEEILILDGEPFKADLAYQKIYCIAEHSIIVIDDYLGLKTLHHLASAKEKLYHCGASSKDAGCKITTITEIKKFADYKAAFKSLLSNKRLILK